MGGVDTSALFPIHVIRYPAYDPPLLFLPSFNMNIDGSKTCESLKSCGDCVMADSCGWCPSLGLCKNGGNTSSDDGLCAVALSTWFWDSPGTDNCSSAFVTQKPTQPAMYGLRVLQDSGLNSIQCLVRPGYSRPLAMITRANAQADVLKMSNVSMGIDGLLTLQPANGFFGSAGINISLTDSEGSVSNFWVPVTVVNVNTPPSISVVPQVQLLLATSGPPIPAANLSDSKWLRYTVSPAAAPSGSWYPSSMLFGPSLQNVIVEGSGCFEVWTNG